MKSSRRVRALVLAASAALLGLVLGPLGPSAASTDPLAYVALGDSSASGSGVPIQYDPACTRSSQNWPHVVAAEIGAELTDVTCGAATIDDLTGRQFGFVPPQFDALTADTDLVTIAISANDIRMGEVVPSCINPLPEPVGSSCKARYTKGGVDQLAERIDAVAPELGEALAEINRRAPDAEVYVVGYGTYFSPGGCWPTDPIWGVDADYIQATFDRLHTMMAEQAAAHGAGYVDIRTPSADHSICAPLSEKWMEGLAPTSIAAPYHPNATGLLNAGLTVAAAVR